MAAAMTEWQRPVPHVVFVERPGVPPPVPYRKAPKPRRNRPGDLPRPPLRRRNTED